jgi:hypothetical protein
MIEQPTLFDGHVLKALGMEAAELGSAAWAAQARAAIKHLAQQPVTFTSEDVIDLVGLPWPDAGANRNNAVGAIMSGAARAGVIYKTGTYVETRRPSSHARIVAVWKGTRPGRSGAHRV